jgi:formylmethanofuran dehydrogenase subunit E
MLDNNDQPEPMLDKTVECPMCHQQVPANQTGRMGGRMLCFGCIAAWFEDDEENEGVSE